PAAVVLQQKYVAVNEYVRACDKVARWLDSQLKLIAGLQTQPDAVEFLTHMEDTLRKASEPGPEPQSIQQDLEMVRRSLGTGFDEARRTCGEAWAASGAAPCCSRWSTATAAAGACTAVPPRRACLPASYWPTPPSRRSRPSPKSSS